MSLMKRKYSHTPTRNISTQMKLMERKYYEYEKNYAHAASRGGGRHSAGPDMPAVRVYRAQIRHHAQFHEYTGSDQHQYGAGHRSDVCNSIRWNRPFGRISFGPLHHRSRKGHYDGCAFSADGNYTGYRGKYRYRRAVRTVQRVCLKPLESAPFYCNSRHVEYRPRGCATDQQLTDHFFFSGGLQQFRQSDLCRSSSHLSHLACHDYNSRFYASKNGIRTGDLCSGEQ